MEVGNPPEAPEWGRSSQVLHPVLSQPVPTSNAENAQVAVSPRTSLLKFPCVHRPGPPHRRATCAPPNPRDQPRAPRREQGARRPDQLEPDAQHSPCSHSAASSRSPRPCMAGGAGGVRIRTHGSGGLGRRCSVLRLALVLPSPLRLLPLRPALPQRPAPCARPISPSGPGRAGPGHLRARSRPHPASPVSFWSPGAPGQCPVSSVQHTVLSTWTELSRAGGQTNLGHSCNCIPHAGEETGWGCPGGPRRGWGWEWRPCCV